MITSGGSGRGLRKANSGHCVACASLSVRFFPFSTGTPTWPSSVIASIGAFTYMTCCPGWGVPLRIASQNWLRLIGNQASLCLRAQTLSAEISEMQAGQSEKKELNSVKCPCSGVCYVTTFERTVFELGERISGFQRYPPCQCSVRQLPLSNY